MDAKKNKTMKNIFKKITMAVLAMASATAYE